MKTKYALCACLCLAKRADHSSMIISEIAQEGSLPQKFLESILHDLSRGGLLHSKKGRNGGYSLARAPHDISLWEIVRLTESLRLDDPVEPNSSTKLEALRCLNEQNVAWLLGNVRHALLNVLEKTSLQDMLDRWTMTQHHSTVDWVI